MLVFDYKCMDCENVEERFIKHIDDFQFCSKCKCEMNKMLSAPAMVNGNEYGDKCGRLRPKSVAI